MQVTGTEDFLGVLLAVAEGDVYGGNVFLQYQNAPVRVIQSDWIEVVGRFIDLHTYQSVGAGPITVLG